LHPEPASLAPELRIALLGLNGSTLANMKELRFDAGRGVWRVAFAFDPKRQTIRLAAGDKRAGARFDRHLE
jgi:hypothetical protein